MESDPCGTLSVVLAIIQMQRQLGELPLPRRLHPWSTPPQEVQQGTADIVSRWEILVHSRTFPNGAPL